MKRGWLILFFLICLFGNNYARDIIVAQDGSGQFTTIQDAINAAPSHSKKLVKIFVKNGIYKEKLIIPADKINIHLTGQNQFATVITHNDYSGKGKINTFTSYTLLVQGDGFIAKDLTIQNNAGPVGQAVALHLEADKVIITNCRIISDQDTIFTGNAGNRQYFTNCYIEGTTDFIFGPAVAVFSNTEIYSKKNSYITAGSTPENAAFGYVFFNCKLTADPQFKKVYLGRPWRPFAKTVWINTEMGDHILPEGWHNWNGDTAGEKTVFYAEYNSSGKGANVAARVPWSKQISDNERKQYTLKNIFGGWNPEKVIRNSIR